MVCAVFGLQSNGDAHIALMGRGVLVITHMRRANFLIVVGELVPHVYAVHNMEWLRVATGLHRAGVGISCSVVGLRSGATHRCAPPLLHACGVRAHAIGGTQLVQPLRGGMASQSWPRVDCVRVMVKC